MSELLENSKNEKIVSVPKEPSDEEDEGEYEPEFKPIVQLPEVKVSTNEENEDMLQKFRAKLYRFDTASEPPEWKERGTGELKFLQHKETNTVRIVMRRDKILKVCANHYITPWMELKPSFGCDKAFVYNVPADYADEEAKHECLAVRFGTLENANLFKETFNKAKEILLTKCIYYNGEGDRALQSEKTDNERSEDEDANDDDKEKEKDESLASMEKELAKLNVSEEDPNAGSSEETK